MKKVLKFLNPFSWWSKTYKTLTVLDVLKLLVFVFTIGGFLGVMWPYWFASL